MTFQYLVTWVNTWSVRRFDQSTPSRAGLHPAGTGTAETPDGVAVGPAEGRAHPPDSRTANTAAARHIHVPGTAMPAIVGDEAAPGRSNGQQNAHRAFPQVGGAQSPAKGLVA
ncbi:hypothetical protein, partial [Spirilliplanes yamanashiensis]|uniref:hypothetical protein n=1 Tax=Spirilliplanes yamanashiensis TaxID=42233 RepID=UPI00195138CE